MRVIPFFCSLIAAAYAGFALDSGAKGSALSCTLIVLLCVGDGIADAVRRK